MNSENIKYIFTDIATKGIIVTKNVLLILRQWVYLYYDLLSNELPRKVPTRPVSARKGGSP